MKFRLRTEKGWDAAIYLENRDNFYICPDDCDQLMLWHTTNCETRKAAWSEARAARAEIKRKLRSIR